MLVISAVFHGNMVDDPVSVEFREHFQAGLGHGMLNMVPESWINLTFPEGQADDVVMQILDGYCVLECVDRAGNEHKIKLFEVAMVGESDNGKRK